MAALELATNNIYPTRSVILKSLDVMEKFYKRLQNVQGEGLSNIKAHLDALYRKRVEVCSSFLEGGMSLEERQAKENKLNFRISAFQEGEWRQRQHLEESVEMVGHIALIHNMVTMDSSE
jgi:hypothetical protein